ncbi:uncharacterized protein G2W53_007921 [Senna tora]|uniref:Uncharacterized protein n=1 Tax=Senna tora TaxID=362788 RepID=A0A834X7C1_9FABA|nr:uncharacterized protein G2W53_007921 [Senna tora]
MEDVNVAMLEALRKIGGVRRNVKHLCRNIWF